MKKETFRDKMSMVAEAGITITQLSLYKKEAITLLAEGHSIQLWGSNKGSAKKRIYSVSWKHAFQGTPAYELRQKAENARYELMGKEAFASDTPVPPPYSVEGGGCIR